MSTSTEHYPPPTSIFLNIILIFIPRRIKLATPKDEPAGTLTASITYGTPQQAPPPPTLHTQRMDDRQQQAIESVRGRIDKTPPHGQFNEETIGT